MTIRHGKRSSPLINKQESVSKKELRDFGLVVGIGFPLLFDFIIPVLIKKNHHFPKTPLIIGAVFLILGLLAPLTLKIPQKIWMKIGHVLGAINSRIILTIVFFVLLTPFAIIFRRNKKAMLTLGNSYRIKSETRDPQSLERMF